jgi:spermidine synthase
VLQEAARFVDSTKKGKNEEYNSALIIGLGAGIAASSFQRHGMSTTIVEIDPAVYQAARSYFGLRDPGTGRVFLEDAGAWVENRSLQSVGSEELFDVVVHDCFSGGGVPEHIYTSEFWRALKAIMHPEGVLAVVRLRLVISPSHMY